MPENGDHACQDDVVGGLAVTGGATEDEPRHDRWDDALKDVEGKSDQPVPLTERAEDIGRTDVPAPDGPQVDALGQSHQQTERYRPEEERPDVKEG